MTSVKAEALPGESVVITVNSVTEPFWQAAREDRLVVAKCGECGKFRMPPTPFCPECQSKVLEWPQLSGRATVFSYSIVHGFRGARDKILVPVVLNLPDAPGARLVSNVVDIEPENVHIGMELEVFFSPIADGWKIPLFRSVGS